MTSPRTSQLCVTICRGPECGDQRSSRQLATAFERELAACGLTRRVEVAWQSCFGRCRSGPNVLVRTESVARSLVAASPLGPGDGVLYQFVQAEHVRRIVEQHLRDGTAVEQWPAPHEPSTAKK